MGNKFRFLSSSLHSVKSPISSASIRVNDLVEDIWFGKGVAPHCECINTP